MPIRGGDLKRVAEAMGWTWETSSGGGSHYKMKRDGITVPVALGNGLKTELSDKLLRKIARQLNCSIEALKNG